MAINIIGWARTASVGDYLTQYEDMTAEERRTETAWWAWHDADASRWSPGDDSSAATREAESRCGKWVAGASDDGPDGNWVVTQDDSDAIMWEGEAPSEAAALQRASEADSGSRCGWDDSQLHAINTELGKRSLRLVADDRGLVVQAVAS